MKLLAPVVAALLATALPAFGQPAEDGDGSGDEQERPPPATPAPSAAEEDSPVIPVARPPREIRKWFIEGELIDPRDTLEAFLSPVLDNANWTEGLEQDQLKELLAAIGYHSTSRVRSMPDGGVSVVLTLEPITTVRYLLVDIKASAIERFREPIFADEIRRRMTLRPGSSLARNPKERQSQLRAEADRLSRYLRNDGFYDAVIKIEERPVGAYSTRIDVIVTPGQPYKLGKITVVGNGSTPAEQVREKFRHNRWCAPFVEQLCIGTARFTRSQLNRDLDGVAELFQKRDYPGVSVLTDFHPAHSYKPNTKTVEFTVTIRRRQKIDVVFEGNTKYSDEKLKKQLTLARDGSYDEVAIESSAESIRRYYQSKGYFEATVTGQRVPFEVFDRVIFSIDRGPQLKVRRVSFGGNQAIRGGRLRDEVNTREFRKIIIGDAGGYATTTQLLQDASRIKALYARRGYADTEVDLRVSRSAREDANAAALAAAVASGKKADGLYVHFEVREGDFLRVESTKITSSDKLSFPSDKLLGASSLKPGKPFRQSSLEADVRRIRQFYLRQGFPRAKIEPSWERDGSKVMINYAIQEGKPATIGKVLIRGNYKTADWVLRDEMGLEEGKPLTLDGTDRAQANLRRSGLFSSVRIN
ncbi:MAG: hypothetical protein KJO07_07310, partial [Deltaproteobacteria bacterium]|nr:hypothetical protein [Deltaproteobacteria bacterium]